MLNNIFTRLKNLFVTNPNDFEVIYIEGYMDTSYKQMAASMQYSAINKKNGKFYHRYIYNHKILLNYFLY